MGSQGEESEKALSAFSETKYEHPAPPGLPASCPTLDLSVSLDGEGSNVLVYRPRDQVVSRIHQAGGRARGREVGATAVRWKPDGQFIAVGWDDGHVRIMGLENNKAAHSIRVADPEAGPTKVSHIGWTRNRVGRRREAKAADAWERMLGKEVKLGDLPRELTFLEVDSTLPKISPLPSGSVGTGEDAMVFTLRTGIDFLFQDFKPEDGEEISVMVVGTENGGVHLSIYDSFPIGKFRYDSKDDDGQLICHASHPDVSTHALLFKPSSKNEGTKVLDIVPLDLSFIVSSPINLSLLASKLTTLQKLLRYLKQAFLHMQVEYKNTQELPTKFLGVIQETLREPESVGPRDIVASLYHTMVTGHVYAPVKEWLVDNLAERGHKRWDKAVTSGLESLRSLLHENLLPALDRAAIILSRLKGLAQFHTSRSDMGLSVPLLTRLGDIIGSLTLVGHRTLLIVMEELELFTSFSTWLRLQIDLLASTSSSASDELAEREMMINQPAVLTYIRRYLLQSPLETFLSANDANDDGPGEFPWAELAARRDGCLLDVVRDEIAKERERQELDETERQHDATSFACQARYLLQFLEREAGSLFQGVAEAQRRSVRFGDRVTVVLGGDAARVDLRMGALYRDNGAVDGVTYTVATTKTKGCEKDAFLFRTTIPIVNGISSKPTTHASALSLPYPVVDVKFINPTVLLALLADPDSRRWLLARIPVAHEGLVWTSYEGQADVPAPRPFEPRTVEVPIGGDDRFIPVEMEVHPSADMRGPVPSRICLLGRDRVTLRVLALRGA